MNIITKLFPGAGWRNPFKSPPAGPDPKWPRTPEPEDARMAEKLYQAWWRAQGGMTHGRINVSLPLWIEIKHNPKFIVKYNAWLAVAHLAMAAGAVENKMQHIMPDLPKESGGSETCGCGTPH